MTATLPDLLDGVTALLGRRNLTQVEFSNWLGGAADGGPNGDGLFPMTDSSGFVRMVPSPAKQLQGGGLNQATVAALPLAARADLHADWQLLGTGTVGGQPVRISAPTIIPQMTADRSVLPGGDSAQWVDGLSANGVQIKIPYSEFQLQFGAVIDPTKPPYNVKYDARKLKGATVTANSNIVTAPYAAFTPADIGKRAVMGNCTNAGPLVAYIGQVQDSKHVALFTGLDFATPANATYSTYQEFIWGTDNTAGLQAAFDAAEPPFPAYGAGFGSSAGSPWQPGGTVVIGGIALASQLRFGSISIVALSTTTCGFVALPVANTQEPFFADKNTGAYATLKPDVYTLKGFSVFGQQYTSYYSSFRRAFEVRGGDSSKFLRGAPYARIEDIDVFDAQWDGIATYGAFAGVMNNIRTFGCAQVGHRAGFWDLNGINWHSEANNGAGFLSIMVGASVTTVRSSFNGTNGGTINIAGGTHPHEYGSNWTECGYGNTITNMRMQESWAHNLCFSTDPLGGTSASAGNKSAFFLGTFDDTGDIVPGQGKGASSSLPGVRAMVYAKGNTAVNNTVNLVTGSGQVKAKNYATNAYFDEGNPSGNHVTITTPGITNANADWYPGGAVSGSTTSTAATAPGPWGTSSSSSIAARGNAVTINGATAP